MIVAFIAAVTPSSIDCTSIINDIAIKRYLGKFCWVFFKASGLSCKTSRDMESDKANQHQSKSNIMKSDPQFMLKIRYISPNADSKLPRNLNDVFLLWYSTVFNHIVQSLILPANVSIQGMTKMLSFSCISLKQLIGIFLLYLHSCKSIHYSTFRQHCAYCPRRTFWYAAAENALRLYAV
jgi:hypothetical protein